MNFNKLKIRKSDKIFKINRSQRKRRKYLLPVLTMIGLSAVIAVPIALFWQDADEPMEKQTVPQYILDRQNQQDNQSENNTSSEESSENTSDTQNSQEDMLSSSAVVPKGEWVDSSYFDDAVFIGDSLSVGIKTYELMPNATVLAVEGLNPQTIMTSTAVENKSGEKVKVIDALKEYNPKKIYIMLGSNGFFWMDKDTFMKYYAEFINEVKAQHPDAIIYIQSIMPVTKEKEESDPRFANSIINEFNADIIKMCEELGVYYLDCASAVAGEDGALPEEASPSDGMHFTATYYRNWMDYLREHTVQ